MCCFHGCQHRNKWVESVSFLILDHLVVKSPTLEKERPWNNPIPAISTLSWTSHIYIIQSIIFRTVKNYIPVFRFGQINTHIHYIYICIYYMSLPYDILTIILISWNYNHMDCPKKPLIRRDSPRRAPGCLPTSTSTRSQGQQTSGSVEGNS